MTGAAEHVRGCYNVPARRGDRILCQGTPGRIVGLRGQHLRVRLDGQRGIVTLHPTRHIEYLPAAGVRRGITGRRYLERGRPVEILAQWSTGAASGPGWVLWWRAPRQAPRNVLICRPDGSRVVRPFRGLRRLEGGG